MHIRFLSSSLVLGIATVLISTAFGEETHNISLDRDTGDSGAEQIIPNQRADVDPVAAAMARRAAKKRACEDAIRARQEEETARLKASREGMVAILVGEMVTIPGRNYLMGRTEVTQAQWEAVMGTNPSQFTDPNRPVESVSWIAVQEFIEVINATEAARNARIRFRLPTAAEWEYACRAGSSGQFGLLADGREGTIHEMGWYMVNTENGSMTKPVAQKKPNAWGLYDMHGNVEEWTQTGSYDSYIVAGGCYGSFDYNCAFPKCLHGRTERNRSFQWVGFRLCADAS